MDSKRTSSSVVQAVRDVPPHDPTAEANLIGAMLFDAEATGKGLALLAASDFYDRRHALVFEAIGRLFAAGERVDSITVGAELGKMGKLSEVGGLSALAEFGEQIVTAAHIEDHARIIRELAQYRALRHLHMRGYDRAQNQAAEVEELVSETMDGLTDIVGHGGHEGLVPLSQCLTGDLSRIEQWQNGDSVPRRVLFGFPKLDELTGGMVPGEITLVGARPGVGKTSFALQAAVAAALRGQHVSIFSLEMTAFNMRLRMISQQARIDERRMRRKRGLNADELEAIRAVRQQLAPVPLAICDRSGITVSRMRLELQTSYVYETPDLVVIDYLQIVQPEKSIENRNNEVARISAGLKQIAKDFGCAVLALSQLNRSSAEGKPRLQDLRDSGALEQDAALVLGLHRAGHNGSDYAEDGEALVLKNRYEGSGSIPLSFYGPQFRFAER